MEAFQEFNSRKLHRLSNQYVYSNHYLKIPFHTEVLTVLLQKHFGR